MSSEAGETPREGERKAEPHLSFVQRLQRAFGADVGDPRIDLQDEEEGPREPPKHPDSRTSTSVEDFVKRLTPSVDVASRYEVKHEVASGGMGTILRVWDGDLRRNLAMKVMHGRGSGSSVTAEGSGETVDPERLGRFLEEAQITGQLDHPGVVPVHDLGIDSRGRCYFTMRFVRGRELKEVFDLAREGKDGWKRTKVLGVILKVCEAMAYAHSKGVVHRDLKPANVMVGRFGETYVMDWGLARVLGRRDSHDLRLRPQPQDASALSLVRTVRRDESDLNPDSPLVTMDGDVVGTPSYMAPEQARGKLEEVGPRSDVYSLGAILYYMLTGQAPYVKPGERVSPHTVLSRVLEGPPTKIEVLSPDETPELIAICVKAMARDPSVRYGSMLEVADDIQAFLENRVVRAYERGSIAEFKKWVVRNKGMAAGIAGMVVLSLASSIFFLVQQKRENDALRAKEQETAKAKDEAVQNLARAQASEHKSNENLRLANEGRAEADRQAGIARKNEERALRSVYAANILAADYSLKLNELGEARARLRETEESLRGWEWRFLSLATNAPLLDLGRFSGLRALAFHPHEDRAILLTGQGRVKIRDLATGRDLPPDDITTTTGAVKSIASLFSNVAFDVSGDGDRIALVGTGSELQVFDLESGENPPGVPRSGLEGHSATTSAVAFSPNGRLLASGDIDGQILVRDALNFEILRRLPGHIAQITALAWSPGSDRLASSSRDGSVRVWDQETGRGLGVLRGHRGAVRGVAWDLLGTHLFTCGDDAAIQMWEVESWRLLRSFLGHDGAVEALDYDPNRGRLASASSDRTLRVWDVATGASRVLRGHESPVLEVAFDSSGDRLLSSEENGTVYVWDAEGDLSTTELRLHRKGVQALAFDPTGKRLVSAAEDNQLVLWDAATGEPLRRMREHSQVVNSVTFSPDGRTILSGSVDKRVLLWDAETGTLRQSYGPFERWIQSAIFTPDGSRVIVATGEKKVRILDAVVGTTLHELPGYQFPADAIVLSPDGKRLATVGRDLYVWDLEGDLTKPVYTRSGRSSIVAWSPDGERIATGTIRGLVQLWDARTGEFLTELQDQTNKVFAITFSPDGTRLVSASLDGSIHVREADTGDTLLVIQEPRGAVRALAFSPDGARLATGVSDGTVRIYETSPSRERRAAARGALELSERARERVTEMFAEQFRMDDVLRELQRDTTMPAPEREAALRLAHLRGDDPLPLFARTLEDCLEPGQPPSFYERALRRASVANDMKAAEAAQSGGFRPTDWQIEALANLAQGIASYRAARYTEAESFLGRGLREEQEREIERRMTSEFGQREKALRLLFLCMAQCQSTHQTEAERSWRLAQQVVLNDVELSQRPELQGLLTEVETLVRSSSAPAGS